MQEALHDVHHHQDTDGAMQEDWPSDEYGEEGSILYACTNALGEEHLGQLTVSQGECPQTQIRSRV